jgi:F420-dependent oxidoreductase-like protein
MNPIHFGVTLPQIKRAWSETQQAAVTFDQLGFDSVWFNDHLYGIPNPQLPILEAWTALSAVAAITQTVQLGTLVSPIGFRNPALLAKMAATLDYISNGRVIVGLGSGWFEAEFTGYDLPFPNVKTRLEQLDEAAALMKLMWTDSAATYEGKHFKVASVFCEPKPVRQPHPPILIGGGGEKVLMRIAAQHAAIWNNLAIHQAQLAEKVAKLHEHCRLINRDAASLIISQQCMVVIGESEADAKAKVEKAAQIYGGHMGAAGAHSIAGTPARCIEAIRHHIERGCTMFIIEFFGRDTREPARLFAEQVMPAFR